MKVFFDENGYMIEESEFNEQKHSSLEIDDMNIEEEKKKTDAYLYKRKMSMYIYSNYPQDKQGSDTSDKMYFETTLKAEGVQNLESLVVGKIKMVQDGNTLVDAVADVDEVIRLGVTQLVKVGIRVAWVMACKAEYHLAVAEGREMNLPAFPNI